MSENETTDSAPKEHFDAFRIVGDASALFAALAAAQGMFPSLEKGKTADVLLKDGKGKYQFSYADLAALQKALRPALSANGISVIQPFYDCGQGLLIRTIMAGHGARVEADVYCSREGRIQELGSALMYLRRYQFKGMTGFEADGEDDDGNKADGNTAEITPTPRRSQPTPPAPKPQNKPAPRAEAPKAPPVDPQVQADIERRRNVTAAPDAAVSTRLEAGPSGVARVEPAIEAAGEPVEESAPTEAAAPSWDTLADGHVPDEVSMPKGSATGGLITELFKLRGFSFEGTQNIAKTLGFIAEQTGGGNPQVKALTYGQGRSVIRALEAMS